MLTLQQSETAGALSDAAVKTLVQTWYRKLDVHAPMIELLPMLAGELDMTLPEATLQGRTDFERWYQGVIRTFFDELHIVRRADVSRDGEYANVDVVVHWEASVWKPPAAKSERIKLDAYQRWVVVPSVGGEPVIRRCVVDRLEYDKGSARL